MSGLELPTPPSQAPSLRDVGPFPRCGLGLGINPLGFHSGLDALLVKLWSWQVVATVSAFCQGKEEAQGRPLSPALLWPVEPSGHRQNHRVEKPSFIQPGPGQSCSVVWPKYKK